MDDFSISVSWPLQLCLKYISFQPEDRDGGAAPGGLSVRVGACELPEKVDFPLMPSSSQLFVCIPFTNLFGSESIFGQGSANSIRQRRDLTGESFRKYDFVLRF